MESRKMDLTSTPAIDPNYATKESLTKGAQRPNIAWIFVTLIVGLCVLAGLFYTGWQPSEKRHAALLSASEEVKAAPLRVAIVAPTKSDAIARLILPGDVQAERETTIYARTNGYLKSWKVDIGDHVKSGDLLAEIDAPEVDIQLEQAKSALKQSEAALTQSKSGLENSKAIKDQASAQLGTAKAKLDYATTLLKRYESLRGSGSLNEEIIIEKDADFKSARSANTAAIAVVTTAQTAIDSAQSAIGVAQANVDVAKVAVTRLEILQSFEKVTAPFDGIITARKTEVGSLVTGGSGTVAQELFHLSKTDVVRVYIDVPQSAAPAVKTGQIVQLILREYPNGKFSGAVARTSNSIDPASRTLRTEVRVPNPTGQLMAGMYAQVHLNIPHQSPPLLLPGSALVVNSQGTQVALVRDGRVHFQPVVVESDFGASVGISSGLAESDIVIANPSERLLEGVQVTTTPAAH
jgi:RND family efflux transporter MFP subunit